MTVVHRPKGRRPGNPDTRSEILDAAREQFAEGGYHATTIRAIAAAADVDPALVMHYFGSKGQLFTATLDLPVSPGDLFGSVLASAGERPGTTLVSEMLTVWDAPEVTETLKAVFRSLVGTGPLHDTVREFAQDSILAVLREHVHGPDAELRAALIASQLSGLLVTRYLIEVEPLNSANIEDIARLVGPVIDRYLDVTTP